MAEFLFARKTGDGSLDEHTADTANPHVVTKTQVGLGNVLDAAQVENAGGVPEVLADVFANRPAFGSAGRIFIATDTWAVYRDTGVAWEELARAPSQIGAGDLGFDPATQAELDAHTGDVANPHAVTAAQTGAVALADLATQAEAEAGASNAKWMTPLRTAQHLAAAVGSTVQAWAAALDTLAANITAFGQSLVAAADAAAGRAVLGLGAAAVENVQASGGGDLLREDGDGSALTSLVTTGTWTPVLTFATPGDLVVAYSAQIGGYMKIGKMVTVRFNVSTSTFTHSTASGALQITGLPFTSEASLIISAAGAGQWTGITKASYTDVAGLVSANDSKVLFNAFGSGQTLGNVIAANVPSGGTVVLSFTITYEAA